jgi:hypothetical protein
MSWETGGSFARGMVEMAVRELGADRVSTERYRGSQFSSQLANSAPRSRRATAAIFSGNLQIMAPILKAKAWR